MRREGENLRDEVTRWFFEDDLPTWIGVGNGASTRGPEFILDYSDAPVHVSTQTSRQWFVDKDAVSSHVARTQNQLRELGYGTTAVLDRNVTLFHDAGAAIDMIWSRRRSDQSEIGASRCAFRDRA